MHRPVSPEQPWDPSWEEPEELVQDPRYAEHGWDGAGEASFDEDPPTLEIDDRLERAVMFGGITAVVGVALCTASAVFGLVVGLLLAA